MLRKLRAALNFVRLGAAGWERMPEWRNQDSEALRKFFQSEAGERLRVTLLAMTVAQALDGTSRAGSDLEYRAGYAAGFRGAVASLDALMAKPVITNPDHRPDVPTDDLAWLNQE
jgi:hypothetical protein